MELTGEIAKRKKHYRRRGPLMAIARELGVSYGHLYAVVDGKRESVRLLNRYLEIFERENPNLPVAPLLNQNEK